jgi:outer membrane protein OmpA-like peptidoglycan-associated protein
MKKFLASLIAIGLIGATTGCTTFDAYTGEQKVTNTAKGAGIGAGVGAVAGYLLNRDKSVGDRQRGALRGAGIGAIGGGGVGYYMDTQEAKLRKQLRDSGVSVKRDGDNIDLIMPGNITFPTNGSDLRADFYDVLDSVALVLNEYQKTTIVVGGHTDNVGSNSHNQQLSEARANSVAHYLKSTGVLAARFDVVGFGENHPVASNSTESGRASNRRVELSLRPITE